MDGSALRWSDVALKSGRMMHRLVQFHAINRSPVAVSEGAVEPPQPGNLADDLLSVMCVALAEHTSTPESCWFCLWEGYGWLHEGSKSTVSF